MTHVSARRPFASAISGVGGLVGLVLALALIDERVRVQLTRFFRGQAATGELATAGARIRELIETVFAALRDQSIEQAPLVIFALAAIILLMFMLRT